MADSVFDKIVDYVDLIRRKPKNDVKFFYFDSDRKFIMDGMRLKLLPLEYAKFYAKEEFYVHVNLNDKKVMFYAYDVESYISGTHLNEEEGYFDWDKVETSIYNFLVLSIKDLCDAVTPYHDVREPNKNLQSSTAYKTQTPIKHTTPANSNYASPVGNTYQYQNNIYNSPYSYGTTAYKEREAFYDKINNSLKENRTSRAIDQINDHIVEMCNNKKFDELDYLIKMIVFDKLNIPAMLGILSATQGADHVLKERKDFYNKVKNHITKIKPSRVDLVLRNLEPGKVYENVQKYEK